MSTMHHLPGCIGHANHRCTIVLAVVHITAHGVVAVMCHPEVLQVPPDIGVDDEPESLLVGSSSHTDHSGCQMDV